MFSNTTSNAALNALGFDALPETKHLFDHKRTDLGIVPADSGDGSISLVGIQMPSEFWEATITTASGKVYKVSTGSGSINRYMEAFDAIAGDDFAHELVVKLIADDMLSAEEVTPTK